VSLTFESSSTLKSSVLFYISTGIKFETRDFLFDGPVRIRHVKFATKSLHNFLTNSDNALQKYLYLFYIFEHVLFIGVVLPLDFPLIQNKLLSAV
jgi:hypothetical protein